VWQHISHHHKLGSCRAVANVGLEHRAWFNLFAIPAGKRKRFRLSEEQRLQAALSGCSAPPTLLAFQDPCYLSVRSFLFFESNYPARDEEASLILVDGNLRPK